jgi:hypothetical protein
VNASNKKLRQRGCQGFVGLEKNSGPPHACAAIRPTLQGKASQLTGFSLQAYLKLTLKETGNGKRRGEAGCFSLGFYRFVIQTCSKDAPLRTSMT